MPENGLRLSVHASVRARQQALDSLFTSSWVLAHKRAHSFGGTGVEPSPRSRRAQADPTLGKGGRRSLTAQPPEPIAASPTVRPGGVDSTPSDCRADRSNGLRYLRDLWSQVLTCECDIRADVLGAWKANKRNIEAWRCSDPTQIAVSGSANVRLCSGHSATSEMFGLSGRGGTPHKKLALPPCQLESRQTPGPRCSPSNHNPVSMVALI